MPSDDVLARWQAADGAPPTANFAPLIRRNNHYFANFPATGTTSLDFSDMLRGYSGSGITVRIGWTPDTATTGNAVWQAAFERHQDDVDDLDGDSFASGKAVTSSAPSGAGREVYDEIAFSDGAEIDSIANGEDFRLRISRLGDNGSDNMSGYAQLKSVEIRET